MTYVIGYMNKVMNVPSIVYGPFNTLTQAIQKMPHIHGYKVYQLIEVTHTETDSNDNDTKLIECIKELYKG